MTRPKFDGATAAWKARSPRWFRPRLLLVLGAALLVVGISGSIGRCAPIADELGGTAFLASDLVGHDLILLRAATVRLNP